MLMDKEKIGLMVKIMLGICIVYHLFAAALVINYYRKEPASYQVVDKSEHDGKCYVELVVEVDPMDYIGIDIGDEYSIKE